MQKITHLLKISHLPILLLIIFFSLFVSVSMDYSIYDLPENFTLTTISSNLYAVPLYIGYPMHKFLLLVDTTSDYTWIRGKNCTFCTFAENIYDDEESISAIKQEEIPYFCYNDIKGKVCGNILYDDIKIGEMYGTKIELLIASEDEYIEFADGVLSLNKNND